MRWRGLFAGLWFTSAGTSASVPIDLLRLETAVERASLPADWSRRIVRGARAPITRIEGSGPDREWVISSAGAAAWFSREWRPRSFDSTLVIAITRQIRAHPAHADLAEPSVNDSAIRYFVVLELPGRGWGRTRMLMYSIGSAQAIEHVGHPRGDLCDLRRPDRAEGRWTTDELRPVIDAAHACGWTIAKVLAIGLLHDSDQTASPASVGIRSIDARGGG